MAEIAKSIADKAIHELTVREWLTLQRIAALADVQPDGAVLRDVVERAGEEAEMILCDLDAYMERQSRAEGERWALAPGSAAAIGDDGLADDGPRFVPDGSHLEPRVSWLGHLAPAEKAEQATDGHG